MANRGEDSRALQEFRRNFFGISRKHAPKPESYLRELQRLVGAASAHLGVSMDIGDCPWADVGIARWWPIRTAQWRTRICP